jgi:hypothetical protein
MNTNGQNATIPIGLTDRQLRLIETAARAVPVRKRDEFLQKLAKHLGPEPSDAAVQAALNAQLDRITHHYLSIANSESKQR